ncbi:MAG TPA: asparagine synthase (glutamine-hydrolyzing) [Thermoleophilaceae bacterium]|nr:asparagine synthase (glutamine-hydrolyzing) [Thermoleophilaceae bacterium]
MCGIGALLDPNGSSGQDAPQRMLEALRHRGPDGEGIRRAGPVTLAHTRLAIIDVAGGDQPLDSEDGAVTVIVNGEIYNHRTLRTKLEERGHRFTTNSDSEVILHAYEESGPGCVRQLNGIFAFVLWDEHRKRLVAARDEFGVKPLYWWSDSTCVAVASEIGAILDAGLARPEVDRIALDHYLACRFVPAPRTLFEGINKLPAASTLIVEAGGQPRVQTWRPPPGAPHRDLSDEDVAGQLAERFADAVERQMMSDVPYGAFLSGGVDSAAVVAAMALRSSRPPTTFTIGFPGAGPVYDEREAAAESARLIGTEHHATATAETDFLTELAAAVPRLEEPCGIPSAPALGQLSRFAADRVKVVLAGQGADEPHGGYGRHQAAALLGRLRHAPAALASPAAAVARALPRAARARRVAHLLGGSGDAERLLRLVEITDAPVREALMGDRRANEAEAERVDLALNVLADVPGRDLLDQALHLDTRMFLPDGILICNDKMSMAASLELRVPFLDVELMRFVERIPARMRVRPRAGKRIHRMAMERILPPGIADRPKHGFATPYDEWLRASLGEEVERRYAPSAPLAALVRPAAVQKLVAEHRRGRADHKAILYCLLELSEWHRAFVEAREPSLAQA